MNELVREVTSYLPFEASEFVLKSGYISHNGKKLGDLEIGMKRQSGTDKVSLAVSIFNKSHAKRSGNDAPLTFYYSPKHVEGAIKLIEGVLWDRRSANGVSSLSIWISETDTLLTQHTIYNRSSAEVVREEGEIKIRCLLQTLLTRKMESK